MGNYNGVMLCLKVFAPLMRVLRLVDGDRKPTKGFLCGELKQTKEEIREALHNVESNYWPIFEIIDARVQGRLDSSLHVMAYLLNPYYFFKDLSILTGYSVLWKFFLLVTLTNKVKS